MSKSRFGIKVSKRAVEIAHLAKNGKKIPKRRGGKKDGGGSTSPGPTLFDKPPAPSVILKSIRPLFPKD